MRLPQSLLTDHNQRMSSVDLRILVTGASGALGSELARQLAKPGVFLCLWGRNVTRLERTARVCREAGAQVATKSIDLSDIAAARAAFVEEDEIHPFHVALLVAGQGDTRPRGDIVEDAEQVARLGLVNFVAPAALAAEIAKRMAKRGDGRIGFVGTAAAAHSLPFAAAYSGSKAGLARYADALRIALIPHGVSVTFVSPGFFDSENARTSPGPRPGGIPVRVVAQRMIRAVESGKAELVTPWPFAVIGWLSRFLPRSLRDRLLLALPMP